MSAYDVETLLSLVLFGVAGLGVLVGIVGIIFGGRR